MPQLVPAAAVVAICAALTCALIKLIRPRLILHMLAVPNARSSHSVATPQGAGLAVVPAVVLICASTAWLWQPAHGALWLAPVLAASVALMVLGALDDTKALSVTWRFTGQALAALVVCLSLPESVRFFPEALPLVFERALLRNWVRRLEGREGRPDRADLLVLLTGSSTFQVESWEFRVNDPGDLCGLRKRGEARSCAWNVGLSFRSGGQAAPV